MSARRRGRRRWRLVPTARTRRRWLRTFRRAPLALRVTMTLAALALLALAVNAVYQLARKPTELFFPVSGTLYKSPAETWREYGPIFRQHSTALITPELLAALAQVEGSGNPIARTYWRWSWRPHFFQLYRPASSAVGMYQITDGTFAEARRYCIHDHAVVEQGAWDDWRSCWFNSLYFRVVPSHAVELTSAYLDRRVASTLARYNVGSASLRQKQSLAAVMHLCGAGAADAFTRRGFRPQPGQRCGDHDVRTYIGRVETMRGVFARLAAQDPLVP